MRKADTAPLGPVHHRGDDGPRLRDEGDGALRRVEMGEARVEPDPRDQDTEAVRADDAQETGPRGIEQGLLQRPTDALPALSETGGDDDRGPRALPPERLDDPGHGLGRGADDRKVRHQRQGLDARVGEHPLDGLVFGIDGHDGPVESALEEVPGEHRPDGSRSLACADERHGPGLEGEFEVANAHLEPTRSARDQTDTSFRHGLPECRAHGRRRCPATWTPAQISPERIWTRAARGEARIADAVSNPCRGDDHY